MEDISTQMKSYCTKEDREQTGCPEDRSVGHCIGPTRTRPTQPIYEIQICQYFRMYRE